MKWLALAVVCGFIVNPVRGQDEAPRNFYVKDKKTEKPAAAEKTEKAAPPTPAKTDKTESVEKPAKSDKAEPPVKAVEKPTPTPAPKKAAAPTPATATIDLKIRSSRTSDNFDPPLDPYGLAEVFHERWDFSSFLISAEEELRFRLNSARARTLRIARAFSALSDEVETRQRNLNSAALAAYLLSRDQSTWSPVEGRNLTEAQLLAVRATMKQDISAMNSALSDYEVLRTSLNASAEEVATMDKNGLAAHPKDEVAEGITVPIATIARRQTESVLQERAMPIEVLKAALAAESLKNTAERRQSIASFAPPPPSGARMPGRIITMPARPSVEVMKDQPKGATMAAPERTAALMFQTAVNAPVYAVRDGVVAFAGAFRGYGDMVVIEHEKGEFSIYSHLANIQVLERQPVKAGSMLGRAGTLPEVGQSGLHFQVRKGKTPVNPEEWLGTKQVERLLTKR